MSNGNVSCTFVKEFKSLNLVFVKIAYKKCIYFIIILFVVENELIVIWNRFPKLHLIRSNGYNNNN